MYLGAVSSGGWPEGSRKPDGHLIMKVLECQTVWTGRSHQVTNMKPGAGEAPGPEPPCPCVRALTRLFCVPAPEVLLDPCRTWCPASACQAVCQLQHAAPQTPQLVRCAACDTEFCSACKASWHPGQGCPESMPITFLPGETRYPLSARVAGKARGGAGGGGKEPHVPSPARCPEHTATSGSVSSSSALIKPGLVG